MTLLALTPFSRKDLVQLSFLLVVSVAVVVATRAPQVSSVSAGEAKRLVDAGALVIDVRIAGQSAVAHVPGAERIPLEDLPASLPKIEAFRERAVVVYCNGGTGRGPEATALLNKAGFSRAVNLQGGFDSWRKAGLPTRAG